MTDEHKQQLDQIADAMGDDTNCEDMLPIMDDEDANRADIRRLRLRAEQAERRAEFAEAAYHAAARRADSAEALNRDLIRRCAETRPADAIEMMEID